MKRVDRFPVTIFKAAFLLLMLLFASGMAYSQCNCPPVTTCGTCVGGMTKLTFKYDDPALIALPATVTVTDGGGVIFLGVIADGGTFEVTAAIEGQPFIGNQITVSSLASTVVIATGCGSPIFVGDSFGYYQVVSGESQSGLPICCALEDMETEPPVILNCPSNITTSLSSASCTKAVTWTAPSATDNCGLQTLTSDYPSGFAFPRGETTVTYTATDRYGNTSTCSFTVTVNDITNPIISNCPINITVNADPTSCGTNVTWTPPTVSDNCSVSMTSNRSPGQFFAVGPTTVTYTATDAGGNTATCSFNVVVNDVTPPIISNCPTTITVNADPTSCGTIVNWTPPTVTDNCTVNMTSDWTPGQFFNVGTTLVTYTATDASNNQTTCSFNVVVNDVTNPVIANCPTTITVNANPTSCGTTVTWTPPTVTDNCAVTMTSDKVPGDVFPVGTTLVTYTATDASNNKSTCTFNVIVNDVTFPVINNCPSNIAINASASSCGTNVTWTPPTATDNCAVTLTPSHAPGSFFPVGTTVVTYKAKDASNNETTCSFNVVVTDATNPVITGCPSNIAVNASTSSCGANVTWTPPTVTDNCVVNMTSSHAPGSFFNVGTTTVTYTAIDASGRQSTCSFNVVVSDVTNPVITGCPSTITVSAAANACNATVSWTPPTVADNCAVNMTSNRNPGTVFNVGTTLVTYTAIDASGNQTQCSFNVVVNDVTKPVFSNCPSNITVNTSTCNAVVSWTAPTASDACGAIVTSDFSPGATFPVGVTAVTYTAKDPSGNLQTCTFNVTVRDNVAPVIANCNHGAIQEVTANNSCVAVVTWTPPTATDNCSATLTSTHNPGDTFPLGKTDVTYTATDPSGNVTVCTFKVFVRDRTNPVINGCITSDITASATTSCGAAVSWTPPTATDNCSVVLTSSHTPGQVFPIGTTVVTYTATDGADNITLCSFNVVVTDQTAPVVSGCPANITVQLTGNTCSQTVTWVPPTFTDNCALTVTSTHSPGDAFTPGITPVTYTAKDASGNTKTCTFNVEVIDASSPVLSACPQDITLTASATCNAVATWTAPTFTDNCSATMASTHSPGATFVLGTTVVTYTVTDAAGNQATCSFKVIVEDKTLPVIENCPANISIVMNANECGKTVSWTPPTATDNCVVTMTSNFLPGHVFPEGTTQVIYTATDQSGNVTTCTFDVVVKDETAPVVVSCVEDIEVSASSTCTAAVSWTPPVFNDNCGAPVVTSTHTAGATFVIGSTTVVYTAKDASGNTTTCSFVVKVIDTTSPVFSNCPTVITAVAGANCSAPVTWSAPIATDNCQVSITSSHSSGHVFPKGVTTVTYTATDAAGNTTRCEFDVTVVDETPPVFTSCPSDISVTAGAGCSAVASWTAPTVSDCSSVTVVGSHVSGSAFPVGTNVVAYTATDIHGRSSTCTFKVIVEDKTAPTFAGCPSNIVVNATETCDAQVTWTAPVASDNCAIASFSGSHTSGMRFALGVTKVTYTAVDIYGNASSCEFNVTVKNVSAPVISGCPANQLVKITYAESASVTWEEPSASALCGGVSLTSNFAPGYDFPVGETLVTYSAIDEAGNSSTCSFTVTVAYEDLEFEVTKLLTPDGDGINDEWQVVNLDKFRENKVTVFDRWGSVVYSAVGYNNQTVVWKGSNDSGAPVPTGTYFYTITVRFREDYVERKGFIEIVR